MPRRPILTLAAAKRMVGEFGVTIGKTKHGEFRVVKKGDPEARAYYTDDLLDGVLTGVNMGEIGNRIVKKNPGGRSLRGKRYNYTTKHGDTVLIGAQVVEVKYVHSEDGKAYRHPFDVGAGMYGLPDGSILIQSEDGKPLWENRTVRG